MTELTSPSRNAMEIDPVKRKILDLVQHASVGSVCLPNFQRDFVWRRDEIADLIRSILRGYYIGSFLILRCDPRKPPFAPVALRGARPEHSSPRPERLILDGQQRLTSLLYALTAPPLSLKDSRKQRRFFVNLNLLLSQPEDDEIVFDRAEGELDGLESTRKQYVDRILPCTSLLRPADFRKWQNGLDDWLLANDREGHALFRQSWRDQCDEGISKFQEFDVPVIELPQIGDDDQYAIGRVCAIFEKLNSTGVALSVYDLLTARLYRSGINLHALWRESCEKHVRIHRWSNGKADTNKFGVLVLRTLALRRDLDPKPSALINLDPTDFERDWRRASVAIETALKLLEHVGQDGLGVFAQKWLPGFGLLPILAALRSEIEEKGLGEGARRDLRRWYWSNVFLERYSSAVESKSRKDYTELLAHWKSGGSPPAVFAEASARIGADGYSVRDSASFASAVYSGVFCLLAIRGARDWRLGEEIELQKLEDHHIFPQAYLKRHGYRARQDKSAINSIVNRTLLSATTNGLIKDGAPADYLISSTVFPSGATTALLDPHFISESCRLAMVQAVENLSPAEASKSYEAFQKSREAEIVAEIRRACGVSTAEEGYAIPEHRLTMR